MLGKYVGAEVEIIYLDRKGNITQRKIRIRSIQNGIIKAVDLASGSPRNFLQTNILAVQPATRHAV